MLIQGDLTPLYTGVSFPNNDFKPTNSKRFLHDGSNYLALTLTDNLNPTLFYYQTNGVQTASYVMQEDYVFDIAYNNTLNSLYSARAAVSGTDILGIILEEIDSTGQVQNNLINYLNVISGTTSGFNDLKNSVELVVNDFNKAYLRVDQDFYDLPITGSLFPSISGYDDSNLNINLTSGVLPSGSFNLIYSRNDNEYIGTFSYQLVIDELSFKSFVVTSGTSPVYNSRDLFLGSPPANNRSDLNTSSGVSLFFNELDHNTLYLVATSGSNSLLYSVNVDSTTTAFAGVNLSDVSLRAGTGNTSNIIAEVLNAWGEPLAGKDVIFTLAQGTGLVNPLVSGTNANGIANSIYTSGTIAGTVRIQIEVED